ncbi:MAG: CHASE2 domain-containing protein, partial [Candidatus Poribacteria bacterium]
LARAGASTIVFDINFAEPRLPEVDQVFADAIRRAGNVVLLEYVETEVSPTIGTSSGLTEVILERERRTPPLAAFQRYAIGSAPFPLPVVPVKVSQFWTFRTTAGDSPTLPVVALQAHALPVYEDFISLLSEVRPNIARELPRDRNDVIQDNVLEEVIRDIRRLFKTDPLIASEMVARLGREALSPETARRRAVLLALIAMYQGGDSLYLNFYGPPRSITTVPYQETSQLLFADAREIDVEGRVVFIGFSGRTQPEQQDTYYSVFSQDSGLNLSGTEIAATAFANLLEAKSIRPLTMPAHLVFVLFWGIVVTASFCLLSTMFAFGLAALGGVLYLAFASYQFDSAAIWWPLTVPLLVQIPVALYGANRLQYVEERTRKEKILENAVARLNQDLVDQLTQNIADIKPDTETIGTCLSTDVEEFTRRVNEKDREGRLSEMGNLMHDYWVTLVGVVAQRGGFVRDFIGDSMIAVWPSPEQREDACRAALAIRAEVERFNRSEGRSRLPTRIGLDSGRLRIGSIGTAGLGTELVGDPANTASRIEAANHDLGTRVLVSELTLRGLEDEFITRKLGAFLLKGKDEALVIHELIEVGTTEHDDQRRERNEIFAKGLSEFQKENWSEARQYFIRLQSKQELDDDGPTRFYLRLCERYAQSGPDKNWNGVALKLPLDPSV